MTDDAGDARAQYGPFREALAHWEAHDREFDGFDVAFDFVPDADRADVTISYVEKIGDCGRTEDDTAVLGCAPVYVSGTIRGHTLVEIRKADGETQLVEVVNHEFGHVLGIEHGEEPMPLMARDNLDLLARPWNRSKVTYAVDYGDDPGAPTPALEAQIEAAVGYLEGGADGRLTPVPTFRRVGSVAEANVVIEVHDASAEDGFTGSRITRYYDGEIRSARYRRVYVALYDLDTEVVAWHAAANLHRSIATNGELHPRLTECEYRCRRDRWWP